MPIYEYQCSICGHQLEVLQNIKDLPLTDCPECHKPGLTKLISAAGFQLKGTGWYKTDYSAKGKQKSAKDTEGSSDSAGASTETEKKLPEAKGDNAAKDKTASSTSTKDGTKSS
jgi:putative FmdB family regulatory protein